MGNQRNLRIKIQRCDSGFALISSIILIPALLCLLMGGLILAHAVLQIKTAETTCREVCLSTQKELKIPLQDILALNSTARRLRKQYTNTKLQLLAAIATGNTAVIAELEYALYLIQLKREALTLKQNLLLQEAQRIQSAFKSLVSKALNTSNTSSPIAGLAIEARPIGDLAPEYFTIEPFNKNQAFSVSGKISLLKDYTSKLKKIGLVPPIDLPIHCGASLKQKGRTWIPVLEMARSF